MGFQQGCGWQFCWRRIAVQEDVQFRLVVEHQYGGSFGVVCRRHIDDYEGSGVAGRQLAYLVGIEQAVQFDFLLPEAGSGPAFLFWGRLPLRGRRGVPNCWRR